MSSMIRFKFMNTESILDNTIYNTSRENTLMYLEITPPESNRPLNSMHVHGDKIPISSVYVYIITRFLNNNNTNRNNDAKLRPCSLIIDLVQI